MKNKDITDITDITDTVWAKMMQKRLEQSNIVAEYIASHKHTTTRFEKIKDTVKHWLSYLTRYQIVDTWTMHDDCDY